MLPFDKVWLFPYVDELSSFPLTIFPIRDHEPIALHTHSDYWELVLIADGKGEHLVEKDVFALEVGDVFMIPRGLRHGYAHCRGLGLVNVMFDPLRLGLDEAELRKIPGYSALFRFEPELRGQHRFQSHLKLSETALNSIMIPLQRLHEEIIARRAGFESAAKALFLLIVVELSRVYGVMPSPMSRDLVRLSPLLDWLKGHLQEDLSVDHLASRAAMSRSTLERLFQKSLGTSPPRYVLSLRLDHAAMMLRETQLSINEVGARVGIDNPHYFSRVFQRHAGISPKAFRMRHRPT